MNGIKLHLFVWMFAWFFVLKKKKGKKKNHTTKYSIYREL